MLFIIIYHYFLQNTDSSLEILLKICCGDFLLEMQQIIRKTCRFDLKTQSDGEMTIFVGKLL